MLDPQTYQQARHNQFNVKARDRNEVNADVHEETEEEEKEEEPQNEVGSSSRGNRTSPRLRAKRTMRRARG